MLNQKENLITKLMEVLHTKKLQNKTQPCTNQQEDLPPQDLSEETPDTRKKADRTTPSKESSPTCFLGVLEKTNNGEEAVYYGSAFAISRRVVVTSASFVVNKNGVAESIAVIPSPNGLYDDVEIYAVKEAFVFPRFYHSDIPNNDFAILVLEGELPEEVGQYALFPEALGNLGIYKSSCIKWSCYNHSYPTDPTEGPIFEMACDRYSIQQTDQYLISINHSSQGQSGSPVSIIRENCEYPAAIGIHCATIGISEEVSVATVITHINQEKVDFLRDKLPGELFRQIIIRHYSLID